MIKVREEKRNLEINSSPLISRDLSWLSFNYRVLDQAGGSHRTVFEKLKFLAITASNLDEFFMIRIGSLYNYIDFDKKRVDYSGLRETSFCKLLLEESQNFVFDQVTCFEKEVKPFFEENGFCIAKAKDLNFGELSLAEEYFNKTIFPMLTPMVFDNYHSFPVLMNQILFFSVVSKASNESENPEKISFIQIPKNIPRFFEIRREGFIVFVPIEEVIRANIDKLYHNVEIESVDLMRITRNGDFTLEESDDIEMDFLEELRQKIRTRKTGRVVRLEIDPGASEKVKKGLMERWDIEDNNVFENYSLIDLTGLWQIAAHPEFKDKMPAPISPVLPQALVQRKSSDEDDIFSLIREGDILLHHPYNSIFPVIDLLEKSSEDPDVLAIKITIYRLAKASRITQALQKAAENGKHVSVLFEVKARFDEENNLREAEKLERAGVFVIYGMSAVKTHTKLLLVVKKEGGKISRYVHMGTGNYNEVTAKLYTDIGLLTNDEEYANDVSEFFNVITGHSENSRYKFLITAPEDLRNQLIHFIEVEKENAQKGLSSGICIKINSLQDRKVIEKLYEASAAGVRIKLIIRGICCLRPGREGLSENITVKSIIGDLLEHSRIFYFHNNGNPVVMGGSADIMNRSFDGRIESLFIIKNPIMKRQSINILIFNLNDNMNSYGMDEEGNYTIVDPIEGLEFDIHKEFFNISGLESTPSKLF
jgi:polyphosphate kinase